MRGYSAGDPLSPVIRYLNELGLTPETGYMPLGSVSFFESFGYSLSTTRGITDRWSATPRGFRILGSGRLPGIWAPESFGRTSCRARPISVTGLIPRPLAPVVGGFSPTAPCATFGIVTSGRIIIGAGPCVGSLLAGDDGILGGLTKSQLEPLMGGRGPRFCAVPGTLNGRISTVLRVPGTRINCVGIPRSAYIPDRSATS